MNINRILYGKYSKIIFSIILGIGLATIFRKSCDNRKCLNFISPNIDEIANNVYEFNDKYYKFIPKATTCDSNKKIVA